MKTSLLERFEGSVRRMENWRHPGGESQMFDPRPRPLSWKDARKTRGVAREARRRGLLPGLSSKTSIRVRIDHIPVKHGLGTRYSLAVPHEITDSSSGPPVGRMTSHDTGLAPTLLPSSIDFEPVRQEVEEWRPSRRIWQRGGGKDDRFRGGVNIGRLSRIGRCCCIVEGKLFYSRLEVWRCSSSLRKRPCHSIFCRFSVGPIAQSLHGAYPKLIIGVLQHFPSCIPFRHLLCQGR